MGFLLEKNEREGPRPPIPILASIWSLTALLVLQHLAHQAMAFEAIRAKRINPTITCVECRMNATRFRGYSFFRFACTL